MKNEMDIADFAEEVRDIVEGRDGFMYGVLEEGRSDNMLYVLMRDYTWLFPKLGWRVDLKAGMLSDGATNARDLGAPEKGWRKYWAIVIGYLMHSPIGQVSKSFWVHDRVCYDGFVLNIETGGKIKVPNVVASMIIAIVLFKEGYKIEPFTWFFATLFGAKDSECMKNGLLWLKKELIHDG